MSTATSSSHTAGRGPLAWLASAEAWLDDKGKPAWIAAMVLGFVLVWPVGLALLAYMIWSGKMGCKTKGSKRGRHAMRMGRTTGNSAFDAYRADTIARLEQEQADFESFLQRLRDARDKAEFDEFMQDRARAAASSGESPDADADPAGPRAGS